MPIYFDNQGRSYRTAAETDFGGRPFVADMYKAAIHNENFRLSLWSGDNLQLTLMSIEPGDDVGLEAHPDVDQFFMVEAGCGLVHFGDSPDLLVYNQPVYPDTGIFIPHGTWHNIVNVGNEPLKLYSIYAPPHHPHGTIHETKADEV
ncbi:MAG: cupin domain-containing protein [Turicibacter sp.]|nr:cupin domain-containing protein [Turicibacter sp.]